jgi:hypothetical protein
MLPESTTCTHETNSYIDSVFQEFRANVVRYMQLIGQELALQARLELAEKTLCLTRDHLQMTIGAAGCAAHHLDWSAAFNEVRFAGVRLVDACMTLLQERGKLTPQEMLTALNAGLFRFRTSSPLREIHAALMKQRRVKRIGDAYVWAGGGEQISLRLKVVKDTVPQETASPTGTEGA